MSDLMVTVTEQSIFDLEDRIEHLQACNGRQYKQIKRLKAIVEVIATFDCDCIEMPASQLYDPCLRCRTKTVLEKDSE